MTAIGALISSNFLVRVAAGLHEYIFIVLTLRVTDANSIEIGLIYFFRFLPYILLGPVAGWVSDTSHKRVILTITNVAMVAVTLVFAATIAGGGLGTVTLCLYGMAVMALRAFYGPALSSSIRFLVAPESLTRKSFKENNTLRGGGM